MNKTLQLKGPFQGRKHPKVVVIPTLSKKEEVTSEHLQRLVQQLKEALLFWQTEKYIEGALISVHYNRIIPKSKRLSFIFNGDGNTTNGCVCGAKFEDNDSENKDKFNKRHVFTYYISIKTLQQSIELISKCQNIIESQFNGTVTSEIVNKINNGEIILEGIKKNHFTSVIVDCNVVLFFDIDENKQKLEEKSLITLYKTNKPVISVLRKIGIDINEDKLLDDYTVSLRRDQIDVLKEKAPYLISMINDFSKFDMPFPENYEQCDIKKIPLPKDEPVIGVIDTRFDKSVYFEKWVQYEDLIDSNLGDEPDDYFHGTAVSSIIVDGHNINPNLDDGCGRFQVRHFAVAKPRGSSSFTILKAIQSIIKSNRDIKVWNLSLGSSLEINENYISPEAYFLDEIQSENDVIFVVAGTNDIDSTMKKQIGAPADSINSLVVNAVDFNDDVASYSRKGPVLGFFNKPDIAYYGGDKFKKIRVCGPQGEAFVSGTSFAAPWITRKLAFLIYKMGLSREVAKALIIDSAAGWEPKDGEGFFIGYGIVPIHISDILKTKDDEIKFVISNVIDEYETYTYSLPVPTLNGFHPFWSRATMVYFPCCNRNQGVDYTCTEMDLHFGRVYKDKSGKVLLKEINDNKQSSWIAANVYEDSARTVFRKWDNVKRISEKIKSIIRPKKAYEAGMWGIRIVTKERGNDKLGKGTHFGIVVTLKEMNGMNRIADFSQLCALYGWLVTPIDVDASLDLFNQANEEIEWE